MMTTRAIAVGLTLLCAVAIAADENDKGAKDDDALQGTWVVLRAELDGKASASSVDDKFTFAKGKMTIETKVKKSDPMDYTLDPAKAPKQIDIAGKPAMLGIYELMGDGLMVCLCFGEKRPTAFKSTEGLLLTLKRDKP